jgi:5-hydroxyisourate hydrolase
MTAISTHVLDLASGLPAAGVGVRLYRRASYADPLLIAQARTDPDGRARLLAPGELTPGPWRLAFEIGAYFAQTGAAVTDPPFLDVVVIDFAVADAARHHHVPLLVSPFGYSTYRGS